MFKFLTKPKFLKVIAMFLVLVFVVNVSGCVTDTSGENGVTNNVKNKKIGIGTNNVGYTVYGASTFEKMTEEIMMGYLLNGRDFSLVVVPGEKDKDGNYLIKNNDNYLYQSALSGVLEYDDKTGQFINPDRKFLLYYVTDVELIDWFESFKKSDNFMNKIMDFADAEIDVGDPRKYKCEILVNMGSGMNSDDFCKGILRNYKIVGEGSNKSYREGEGVFKDPLTGGMVLFFGYSSIEGYITYDDIKNYRGSVVGNNLSDSCDDRNNDGKVECIDYNPDEIRAHDVQAYLRNEDYRRTLKNIYEYTDSDLASPSVGLVNTVVGLHSEIALNRASIGYGRLKTTYELLMQSLLLDYKELGAVKISELESKIVEEIQRMVLDLDLTNPFETIKEQKKMDTYQSAVDILESMFYSCVSGCDTENPIYRYDPHTKLDEAAEKEAFNIKMSAALQSRYTEIVDYPSVDNLLTGKSYGKDDYSRNGGYDGNLNYDTALKLSKGEGTQDTIRDTDNSYLLLVTSDGFVLDRGTEEDQMALGFAEMTDFGNILAEMVRMDGCPSKSAAAEMYNLLSNLKIAIGTAMAVTGLAVAAAAAIAATVMTTANAVATSTVAVVICKIAGANAAAPYPGARIVSAVLIAIAALIFAGIGIYTAVQGAKEKERLKGMGASKENYCQSYAATFNFLFEKLELTIPIYHYKVPREAKNSEYNKNLSVNYCSANNYVYNSKSGYCELYGEGGVVERKMTPVSIPLYYYANVEQVSKLGLMGSPTLMFFNKGKLVDSIVGAATPDFIVEMLRLWGLLAMREIVYQAELLKDKINVYHTTNANARTHTIKSARYCVTADYNKNLYSEDNYPESFCYSVSASGNLVEGSYETSINKNYWNSRGEVVQILTTTYDDNFRNIIANKIKNNPNYVNYFESTPAAKFSDQKGKYNAKKVEDTVGMDVSIDESSNQIHVISTGENMSYYAMYTYGDMRYYLVSGLDYTTIYGRSNLENKVYKVATVEGDITKFYIDKGEIVGNIQKETIYTVVIRGTEYIIKDTNVLNQGIVVGKINKDKTEITIGGSTYKQFTINAKEVDKVVKMVKIDGVNYIIDGESILLSNQVIGSINKEQTMITIDTQTYTNFEIIEYKLIRINGVDYKINNNRIYNMFDDFKGYIDPDSNKIIIGDYEYIFGSSGNINEAYSTLDFIRYINGEQVVFENEKRVEMPLYYLATVAEYPQAKGDEDGEYLYQRGKKGKSLKDDEVKENDTAIKDSDTINYYSATIQIGTIILMLNDNGEVSVTINWEKGGN